MSAYSTIRITRSAAKRALVNRIMSYVRDDEIERMLFDLILEHKLRNCRIVDDDEENEDFLLLD